MYIYWFGHAERTDEGRLARKVVIADVSEIRLTGRPMDGWMDGWMNRYEECIEFI